MGKVAHEIGRTILEEHERGKAEEKPYGAGRWSPFSSQGELFLDPHLAASLKKMAETTPDSEIKVHTGGMPNTTSRAHPRFLKPGSQEIQITFFINC